MRSNEMISAYLKTDSGSSTTDPHTNRFMTTCGKEFAIPRITSDAIEGVLSRSVYSEILLPSLSRTFKYRGCSVGPWLAINETGNDCARPMTNELRTNKPQRAMRERGFMAFNSRDQSLSPQLNLLAVARIFNPDFASGTILQVKTARRPRQIVQGLDILRSFVQ